MQDFLLKIEMWVRLTWNTNPWIVVFIGLCILGFAMIFSFSRNCVIISFCYACFLFGLARIGIWLNLLSLPWIDGWGIVLINLIPVEIIAFGFGLIGLINNVREKSGKIAFLLVTLLFIAAITISIPNINNILFWRGEDGEFLEAIIKPELLSTLVDAKGNHIWLSNNTSAKNVSFQELQIFLSIDRSESSEYIYGQYVCADFAETLHNNAEKAGIRCGFVGITLSQ